MAKAATRASTITTLVIGRVKVPVGLFATKDKPGKLVEFTTAGPNGGVLMLQDGTRAAPLSADEPAPERNVAPGSSDPFADDPGSDAPPVSGGGAPAPSRPSATSEPSTPAEFWRVLVEEGTGVRVARSQVRRGVRLEDGSFIDVTDHLARIEEDAKLEQMEVVSFIDVGQVERARVVDAYYVGANEAEGMKPLRLIFEAMRRRRRVAVVRWCAKSRQSLGVLSAHKSGTLMLLKLAWAEDFREPPAKALSIERAASRISEDEIQMACRLVEAMSDSVTSLDELRDDAIAAREDLYARALAGEVEPIEPPRAEPEPAEDAWAASLAEMMAAAGKG